MEEEKPFMCSICNECFITLSTLEKHVNVHTRKTIKPKNKKKKFECYECGKGFKTNVKLLLHLTKHKMSHIGEKYFKCSYCPAAFLLRSDLELHDMTHTGNKPFKCTLCDYQCVRKPILEHHMNTHTGETPFKCDFYGCGAECGSPATLKKHKQKHGILLLSTNSTYRMFPQLTGRQWRTLVVLCTSNFCVYGANALLPPFYPALAEFRGATVLQYGFVFGMSRLVMGVISPIYGSYIGIVGPRFMLTAGLFTAAGTCALMGVMNHVYGYGSFLGLSFGVQVVAALGSATLPNAITLLVNKEFPDSVGSVFALTETATGVGCIVSPLIGGLLYQAAGYTAPFVAAACVLLLPALLTVLVLPEAKANKELGTEDSTITALDVLRQPTLAVFLLCNLVGAFTYGFLVCGMNQLLKPLQLSQQQTGLVFVLVSSVYSVAVSAWGRLCDTLVKPITVTIMCTSTICIAMLFLGPAPFIPLDLNLPMCVVAISVIMVSGSGQIVGAFSGLFRAAEDCGFPKGTGTQGVLGGCINAAFNLGCFLGYSCTGVFLETLGYRWSTMVVVSLQTVLLIIMSACHLCRRNQTVYKPLAQENNKNNDNNNNNFKTLQSSYGSFEPV